MRYFSQRNKYKVEYSGYEEASEQLRNRLRSIIDKNTDEDQNFFGDPYSNDWVSWEDLRHLVHKYLLKENPLGIILTGSFDEVFTVVEIYWDLVNKLDGARREKVFIELCQAFILSGSVYQINPREGRIEIIPSKELADEIKQTSSLLHQNAKAYDTYRNAVAGLLNRSMKSSDVVRDVYVASEAYLKNMTQETQYSNAIKKLEKKGVINSEQKSIMDKLYAFRSNTHGTTHAGSAPTVNEKQALWFLDTMSAQLRYIDTQLKQTV